VNVPAKIVFLCEKEQSPQHNSFSALVSAAFECKVTATSENKTY
jgi:hypothetical protein